MSEMAAFESDIADFIRRSVAESARTLAWMASLADGIIHACSYCLILGTEIFIYMLLARSPDVSSREPALPFAARLIIECSLAALSMHLNRAVLDSSGLLQARKETDDIGSRDLG